ncbi:MAG: TIM barrel protein [Oscillospiraceae bacterium]|jgi:deoxyribonuclease-4|nr:TIM barrel protein [Oscillospiraceae bacterium]
MAIKFGPAGHSASFFERYSKLEDLPIYLSNFRLNAYEYQCGHGIRISQSAAQKFGKLMAKSGIYLSVHSPYYISIASVDEEKRLNSVKYILQTAEIAKAMGAERIVVHAGSCAKISRNQAMDFAKTTLKMAIDELKSSGLESVHICPETMGKVNQLGTIEEIFELCAQDVSIIPCIDFGHMDARGQGSLPDEASFEKIFEAIENNLGYCKLKNMHIHFSKVEFTSGGERRHCTFEEQHFGADFKHLLNVVIKKHCQPVIICESSGTQAEDAKTMKDYYMANVGE